MRLNYSDSDVIKAIAEELHCKTNDISNPEILRRSIDARKKNQSPRYILSVEIDYSGRPLSETPGKIEKAPRPEPPLTFPLLSPAPHSSAHRCRCRSCRPDGGTDAGRGRL
jgi:hypothetical protein